MNDRDIVAIIQRDEDARVIVKHYAPDGKCQLCGNVVDYVFFTLKAVGVEAQELRNTRPEYKGRKLYRYVCENNFPAGYEVRCRGCANRTRLRE